MPEDASHPWSGYRLYKVFHKDQKRWYAQLVSPSHRTTVAWARYVMAVHLKRHLNDDEHVDHIDEDKTNDDISNLQIMSNAENSAKHREHHDIRREMVTLTCPTCGNEFTRQRHRTHLSKGGKPSNCSRRCGGIASHRNKSVGQ